MDSIPVPDYQTKPFRVIYIKDPETDPHIMEDPHRNWPIIDCGFHDGVDDFIEGCMPGRYIFMANTIDGTDLEVIIS